MKAMRKIAWLLCFVLIVTTVIRNDNLKADAQGEGTTFTINVSDESGIDGNSVAYRFNSGEEWTTVPFGDAIDISSSSVIMIQARTAADGVEVDCSNSVGFAENTDFGGITGENGGTFDLVSDASYELNLRFLNNHQGGNSGNLTFSYDDTGLGFGEIQWQDAENNWHTQQENGTVSAVAVRIVYSNNGALADYTEMRVDGTAILADNKTALESDAGFALDSDKNYVFEHIQFMNSSNNGNGDQPSVGPGTAFDGIVYFVWQGANDSLCVHEITGLEASLKEDPKGGSTYDIIYIPVSTVKDDSTGEQFEIGNKAYYWVWRSAEQFIRDNSSSYSAFVKALESIGDDATIRNTIIDPCGAIDGKSSVCTNGDRQFRATIYGDTTFEGVAFSSNADNYTYFPGFWDPVFFSNTVDISETTAENPAVYDAFILEPTIHFGMAEHSENAFTGIRALNVPSGAVTISGNGTSGYDIQFGSNFFDNVVFEITTDQGNYYLEIVRTAMQTFHEGGRDGQSLKIGAEVYYDENKSYNDYEVYATIHYTDGSVSMQKAEASEIAFAGNGDPLPPGTYETDGGIGLKSARYSIPVTSNVVGIDFNAIESGALSSNAYGGSYFGSGNGVYIDVTPWVK